ncbi:hypothetical protein BU23DRAFT_568787 [Bimuria novae-zelandiae CBS 107.79]|uniref:Uncharacterized protein n=1 Tax=Bimuria novae-zelandiae CBS 107.79 TaxID=1447943 RepID=A0A6A5V6X2_9PLEO|nr:hypothetical protein BU23DRAFT_568787 [Bimuria novae-zelandiae CBS 107.79]
MVAIDMLGGILIFFVAIATAWPLTPSEHFEAIVKRLDKPPVPNSQELLAHFDRVPLNSCLFYTGGTLDAAVKYGETNTLFLINELDLDGWTTQSEDTPNEFGDSDYAPDCPMSFAFQQPYFDAGVGWGKDEHAKYWDNLSEAIALKCRGDAYLALPPALTIPEDSVFARMEFSALQRNAAITRLLGVVVNDDDSFLELPYPLWERCAAP